MQSIIDGQKPIDRAKAAETRIAELERVIRGMFPMWIAAMRYCEHGRRSDIATMQNYWSDMDNSMTSEDIQLMLSLVTEKGSEK